MFLSRLHLDLRCREARRDLSDPYQLHSTLCRAFSSPERKCPENEFLWRIEPETDPDGIPRILLQSRGNPDWTGIAVRGWLAKTDPPIDLRERLKIDFLKSGQRFRFRLRANPCVTRNGKRLGLFRLVDQEAWVVRKGGQHGFSIPQLVSFDLPKRTLGGIQISISHEQMLKGKQRSGKPIRIFSVLYDGILTVTEPAKFKSTLQTGIGHGKAMGLGLLSIVPIA